MGQPQLLEPSETIEGSRGGSPPQVTAASTFFDTVMDQAGDDDDSQHRAEEAEHSPEGGAPVLSRDVKTGSEQTDLPTTGSTANVPTSGVAAESEAITLEARLGQNQPLLARIYDYLPACLGDYEQAVYTGFPNFEFRSYSPLLEQAYNALLTGDPGEGDGIEREEGYELNRNIGSQHYRFLWDRTCVPPRRQVLVTDGEGQHVLLEGAIAPDGAMSLGSLRIELPVLGSYDFKITTRYHSVTITPPRGSARRPAAVFSFYHPFGDGPVESSTAGTIPPWRGPTGQTG